MGWAYKRAEHLVRVAIDRDRLLEHGERVLIGVSGGADSLCLVHILTRLNTRSRRGWQLHAVYIDPGFPGSRADRVARLCQRVGLECEVRRVDVPAACRRTHASPCYVCSRLRRRALFEAAHEFGARKVAFGHHLEDVNETFLINLLCTASGSTILSKQSLFEGAITVVRPLYYLEEKLIRTCLRQLRLRPVSKACPYSHTGFRIALRRFLTKFESLIPNANTNLFWGIHNLKIEYLPRKGSHYSSS